MTRDPYMVLSMTKKKKTSGGPSIRLQSECWAFCDQCIIWCLINPRRLEDSSAVRLTNKQTNNQKVPATLCVCAGLFREVRSVPGVPQAGGGWEMDAGAQDRGEDS